MNKLSMHAAAVEVAEDPAAIAMDDAGHGDEDFDDLALDDDEALDTDVGEGPDESGGSAPGIAPSLACSAQEELALIDAARAGDAAARERLVRLNQGMVAWVARRYRASGVPRDDLMSEGMIGLLTAIERFDAGRGARFGTYARWWVLDAMRSCVLRQSRVVRLPANVVKELGRVDRAIEADGAARGGGAPRSVIDRVAQRLQRTGDHVERLLTLREPVVSLDGEEGAAVAEQADAQHSAATASPEAVALVSELRARMYSLMGALTERERIVLAARYGLDTGEPATLEAVAATLGLTAERVRQLQRDALLRLRRAFIEQGLIEGASDAGAGTAR